MPVLGLLQRLFHQPSPTMSTLVGFGSLVSESSARDSFEFDNFRIGEVRGWRRSFCQANWINAMPSRGWGSVDNGDTAALAMIPAADEHASRVALIDVDDEGLRAFYEREVGYNIVSTAFVVRAEDGTISESGTALMCAACANDEESDALWAPGGVMEAHCAGSSYVTEWMRRSLRPLWPSPCATSTSRSSGGSDSGSGGSAQPTLLPSPGYLRLVAAAHEIAGMLDHLLDDTLLNDRQTTLRAYCSSSSGHAHKIIAALSADDLDSDAPSLRFYDEHGQQQA